MEDTLYNKIPVNTPSSGMSFEFDPEVTGEGLEVLDDEAQLERLRHAIQKGLDSPVIELDWRQHLLELNMKYCNVPQ